MACNFCRDSIEGLKEIPLNPKPIELSTPQGGGLILSPELSMDLAGIGGGNKLYQCQWCTEYWHKKLSVKITHGEAGPEEWQTGLQLGFVEKVEPMGYDLDKIRGDLT